MAAAFLGGRQGGVDDLLKLARYRRTIERSYDRALHNLLMLHRVRGVWSRPNLVEPEDEEHWEAPPPVKDRWTGPVTQAQPRPQREDEDDVSVTVQRVIIGENGERMSWEEYLAREKAAQESQKPSAPEGTEPAAEEPASGTARRVERPKADILRNGPPVADEIPDEPEFFAPLSGLPRDRRRF